MVQRHVVAATNDVAIALHLVPGDQPAAFFRIGLAGMREDVVKHARGNDLRFSVRIHRDALAHQARHPARPDSQTAPPTAGGRERSGTVGNSGGACKPVVSVPG